MIPDRPAGSVLLRGEALRVVDPPPVFQQVVAALLRFPHMLGEGVGAVADFAVDMRHITKKFPLVLANDDVNFNVLQGQIHALVGENGAGKSTLINQVLYPTLARHLYGSDLETGRHGHVEGLDCIDKVINIDQSPIGRTPRSNPVTYVKAWDEIRKLFSQIEEARRRERPAGEAPVQRDVAEATLTGIMGREDARSVG